MMLDNRNHLSIQSGIRSNTNSTNNGVPLKKINEANFFSERVSS